MNNGPEHGGRVQTARADTAAAGLLLWLLQLALPRGLPAGSFTLPTPITSPKKKNAMLRSTHCFPPPLSLPYFPIHNITR